MKISIITPSFRSAGWLKLCIPSVADQTAVDVEHIVQDSLSDDGTQDWLPHDRRVKAFFEKDSGMYDAVNRGLRRASGEVLAYLNCDEQYLPGALKAVVDHFQRSPNTDVLLAHTIITDAEGKFICCRKCLSPGRNLGWLHCPTITSSVFFHRRVLDQHGHFYDTKWRDVADFYWMMGAAQRGFRFATLDRFTSVFADTGDNMNLKPNALRERGERLNRMPGWVRRFSLPLLQVQRARLFMAGAYSQKPFTYSLYTRVNPEQRTDIFVAKPTTIWWDRHQTAAPQA
jgi:glycosyltransferase involved in cell wall biosynthesis